MRFLGFLDDAASLAPAMDALLLPSEYEHMPLALGEAMLAGLPVVTTPWRGHESFVRDGVTGFVASGWKPRELLAAAVRAASDARIAVTDAALSFARDRFDPETHVVRHAELYRSLAASR